MRRCIPKREMGEAISLEDVLSLMTVIFVLFVLFFVPLVNLDRLHLERAQRDEYWQKLAEWLAAHASVSERGLPYVQAFGMDGHRLLVSEDKQRHQVFWVEGLNADGTIIIVEHDRKREAFQSMIVRGHSAVVTYRYGDIRWSAAEQVWFTSADSVDYGINPASSELKNRFRAWTQEMRGF